MLEIIPIRIGAGLNKNPITKEEVGYSLRNTEEGKQRLAIHIGVAVMAKFGYKFGDRFIMGPINAKAGYWGIQRTADGPGHKLSRAASTTSSGRLQVGKGGCKYFPKKNIPMTPIKWDVDGDVLFFEIPKNGSGG